MLHIVQSKDFIRRLLICVCEGPDTKNALTTETTYIYVCFTSLTTRSSTHSYVGIWVSTRHVCNQIFLHEIVLVVLPVS